MGLSAVLIMTAQSWRSIRSVVVLFFLLLPAETFYISTGFQSRARRIAVCAEPNFSFVRIDSTRLFSQEDDENSHQPSKNTPGRAGGRAPRKPRIIKPRRAKGLATLSKSFLLPLLGLCLVFRLLLGSSSFVYYESSVYESRTYVDGKVETSRKESVRSNVPGWVERQATQSPTEKPLLKLEEDELDADFRTMRMQMQERMLDNMF
jgi:hypothetical protein